MRLLATLLLMFMGLPMASPLLALTSGADEHLPACCRRDGRHHCSAMMTAGTDAAASRTPQMRAPVEKCPMCPQVSAAAPHDIGAPPVSGILFASVASHPAGVAQTESKWRVSRYRSRQKRGPPAPISS